MYLYGRTSDKDKAIVCRTVSVGSQIYFNESNLIRTLQVAWHPYSDTHLGILSSDSVFRLFDLSSDLLRPEQEYYLQPVEPGRPRHAASICPVDFSFGGDHLWDRFSVFTLFSDGSVYILCPIVPFGSVHKWESVLEIYRDAHTFGLKSANQTAVSNSNLAISWLEATFPELDNGAMEGENLLALKARPYVLFDASLCLQGPLQRVHGGEEDLDVRGVECEGRAVSFLYNVISKDSILVIAWSGGQLQIDALADEIQPVWTIDNPPRVRVDSHDRICALAMICELTSSEIPVVKLDQPLDHTVWLSHPPPLLRLAIVDLALPRKTESGYNIMMFSDPLMPERIYSVHDGGIDSILLHFLPFTSQSSGKEETVRAPSVHPVLSTCQADKSSPLCGFEALSDSFGYSWIIGVTSMQECFVLEMKTWNLLLPIHVDVEKKSPISEEWKEGETPYIISKELLSGPKVVLVPQASSNLRSVAADSIEGRSSLHQYFKLFHENYVEYAHKVFFELKHHGPHLKRIIDDQHARLSEAQEKLLKVEEKQSGLGERIDRAIQVHNLLEQRLERLRNLPGAHKKPLSRAEREFKSELDHFTGVELDALRTSIDTLKSRLRRHTQSSKADVLNQQRQLSGKNYVQDVQISQLKTSLAKLSLVNSENSKKVKLVESVLKGQESSR
ncbi:nuclear pore complex protein NUP88 isoform X2 [Hevea brasiliensis]|nr:nuclear pore complex protein NUP88 isoform X2 [Hevea brasiliensis]